MKKASNILEVALLLCFVLALSFALMTIYNSRKVILTNMSKVTVTAK